MLKVLKDLVVSVPVFGGWLEYLRCYSGNDSGEERLERLDGGGVCIYYINAEMQIICTTTVFR